MIPTLSPQKRAAMKLSLVPGVGPRIYQDLVQRFGDPLSVFSAAPSELRSTPGVGPKLLAALLQADELTNVDQELALCGEHQISLLATSDDDYPRPLQDIPDPPPLLYLRGNLLPTDAIAIAIVGSRHATHYGSTQAERLAGGLARAGITVVSGLARGIDKAAHRGALAAGGRTLAVLGSGVLNIYPPEHDKLAQDVIAHGALLSEYPPQKPPSQGSFPQRNRIVTGLSLGVIVVEASERSGALISARHALEQNREVFAVPGSVDSRNSRGCHRLIRDGARLVETVDDVLEELGPLVEGVTTDNGAEVRHPAELKLSEMERQVLDAIPTEPATIDTVVASSRLPIHNVLATISVLEMRRLVRRLGGQRLVRL
ncbi:DNA-processing protein DprA [Lignipirellula cremea]|uniref:Uncharacterized protein n=1 Tax=Lignipirellula cremea TaxID=2528010 RepID=A0A518E136_9BACT|nr:DNA-processing protein DprA [Lignipirellula cremea]QDU97809.1 hypothetical protein Pla8534_56660 [Lignipirellula cremea]